MRRFILAFGLMLLCATPGLTQSGLFIRNGFSSIANPVSGQSWVFNSANNQVYVFNGSQFVQVSPPVGNFTASTNPGSGNDNTQGFQAGSLWVNTNSSLVFACISAQTSAAVWLQLGTNASALTQSFLTEANETSTLTNSYVLTAGSNITLTPGANTLTIATTGYGAAAVENLDNDIVDDGSGNLTIAASGASAGSYTNTNLTINAQGRITAASNGSSGGGLTFGGDGSTGSFTAAGIFTDTPGNQKNFTNFEVNTSATYTLISKEVINATGTVTIIGTLTGSSCGGGPSPGQAGGAAGLVYPVASGMTSSGGGGGGGNGGAGGHGGSGSTGSLYSFYGPGGSGGSVASFASLSSSAGGFGGTSNSGSALIPGGGTVIIAAIGEVEVTSTGVITGTSANGSSGSAGSGGGSGGTIAIYSQNSIVDNGDIEASGGEGLAGTNAAGEGGVGDAGGGGGGYVLLMAPSISGTGISSIAVAGGGATTGNASSRVTATAGSAGHIYKVTATPTLPLVYVSPKMLGIYAEIANANGTSHSTAKGNIIELSGHTWITFVAAIQAKNHNEFNQLCSKYSLEPTVSQVAVGDAPDFNPNG